MLIKHDLFMKVRDNPGFVDRGELNKFMNGSGNVICSEDSIIELSVLLVQFVKTLRGEDYVLLLVDGSLYMKHISSFLNIVKEELV